MSVFILVPKGKAKECSNYLTITLISYASKVMLKILQARLQQCMNQEFPKVQTGFQRGRGTRNQVANIHIHWIMKESKEFHKNIYFCFIDYVKEFDCVDHKKLWKVFKETGIPDHLTCRNLYTGQEATVKNWTWNNRLVPNRKRSTARLYIVTLLINLYAGYIMQNAGLDEAQAGIKIAGRNINNLRYAGDTTLWAEVKN